MSYQELSIVDENGNLIDGNVSLAAGAQTTVTIKYKSDDTTTTGVGFTVNFDSQLSGAASLLHTADNIAGGNASTADGTTSLAFGYASLFGAFPGSGEVDLATVTLTNNGNSAVTLPVFLAFTSSHAGYEEVNLNPEPLPPLQISTNDIVENSGENQVIASVVDGIDGATYSLVDNTNYGGGEASQAEIVALSQAADTQNVYISQSTLSEDGSQLELVIAYNSGDSTTTGVGFTVDFDASQFALNNVNLITANDNIAAGNASTNGGTTSLAFGYASLFGSFPNANAVDLATVTLDITGSGPANIDISATSGHAGYTLVTQGHSLDLPAVSPLSIDSATGDVTLSVNPDFESVPSYSFDIVSNGGAQSGSATANVVNADEQAPVFAESAVAADAIAENSGAGQVVYTAQADDSADASAGVSYSLAGADAAAFSIDSATGAVTLTANPDYEAQSSYSFTVVADDGVNATASQTVTLEVTDVDDTAPVISSSSDAGSVVENSGAGQVVYTAEASDETSGVTYSLTGADAAAFSIDANGAVTLNDNPDYEAKSSYAFTVVAADDAGNTAEQEVTLSITDIIEENPVFIETPDPVMDENGVFAYTALATVDSSGAVIYSLSDDFGGVFSIDSATGVVSMSESPDYEAGINYSFTVLATDSTGNSSTKTVSLTLNNLDDTAPTFAQDSVSVEIVENAGVGQVVYSVQADDSADISDGVSYGFYNSNTSYAAPTAEEASQHLYVSQTSLSEDDTKLTAIISYDSLEPETAGLGLRVHYDSAALTLDTITDALSADLIFTNGQPTADTDDLDANANTDTYIDAGWASLYGNWPNNSLPADVLTLTFDINSGASATTEIDLSALASPVGFSFDGSAETISLSSSADSIGALSIDAISGEVTLSENPDYETTPEYNFSVIAIDAAGNQSNPQFVSLAVNDEPLSISSSDTADAIDENIGAGQAVYSTTVTGAEDGDQIAYSLVTADHQQLGGIEQRFVENLDGTITLQLYVSPSILGDYPSSIENYDLVINYNTDEITNTNLSLHPDLRMQIVEETVPGEIKVAGVFLTDLPDITNESLLELNFEFQENIASTEFTVLDTLLGTDDTVLDQSVTHYYDSRGFTIDETTGVVSLIENPDHESQTDYIFTVKAENLLTGQSDTQTVVLSVNDLDDAQPVVTSSNVAAAIDENSGAGQIIYTATVDDSGDISGGISYSLVDGSDAALSIDAVSGEVILNHNPDHEAQSQYSFAVIATDAAGNASVAQSVTLDINDLDDAAPVVISAISADTVDENDASGQVVYIATADDSGDNVADGPVTFSLTANSDAEFSIDSVTGEVSFNAAADHEADDEYTFSVIATDAAGNASEVQSVTMSINDLDDTAPIITSVDTAVAIDENSGADQVIYTATADDSADVSDGFTFSLADGSDTALSIDAITGEVTLSANPDYEAKSQYSFAVIATDAAGNVSESQSVTLDVNNLDEVAATITSGNAVDTITENSGAGQVIYTATADDSADISDGFTFSLSQDSDAALSIDENTGEVTLTADPDYEAQNQYNFAVVVTDAAGNTSVSEQLSFYISDIDDFSLGGQVYHWNTHALLDNVTVTMRDADSDLLMETVTSNASGDYIIDELASGQVNVTVERDLQEEDQGRFVTSLDALAALKMSVGINPNAMDNTGDNQINVSPYQFIAADVNKSGNVTALDALEILRMAVKMPGAYEKEWMFFDESVDLWNENASVGENPLSIDKDNVPSYSNSLTVQIDQAETKNFVGLILGDVYSSWKAPTGSQTVAEDQFVELEDSGIAPMYQWGMSPQEFALKSSSTAEDLLEKSGAGQVVYTIKSSRTDATYSLGDSADSALFTVDAASGAVTLTANPDYGTQSSYSFEVVATDSNNVSLSQMVSLAIVERDPSVPFFDSSDSAAAIDENSGEDQVIYTAVAENPDTGIDAGAITYSLSGSSDAALSIDANTGAVSLATDPNYEVQSQYSFAVIATNKEGNSAQLDVTLEINNLDDTAPIITSATAVSVDENTGANQLVYTAVADDSADISGGVTYTLVDNSLAVSEINVPQLVADTQHVYVSESTKSQDGNQETIVISYDADNAAATGLGLQIHFDSSALSVSSLFDVLSKDNIFAFDTPIADANDDDNDASTDMYLSLGWASMDGTWPGSVPTEITSVTFDILDTSNGVSTINLASSGNSVGYNYDGQSHDILLELDVSALSIDTNSGEVTLLEDPDFETKAEYNFDIIATDAAGNVSQTESVTLSVNDINESPAITSDNLAVVLESNGSDQEVYTATSNIDGATFSLVDNTVYPVIDNADPVFTVISVPEQLPSTQHVYISDSQISEDGSQVAVTYSYKSDDSTTTGVGFSVDFDSSILNFSEVSNVFTGAIADGSLNADGNSLSFGWASLFGSFPGSSPVELATITFDIDPSATDYAQLNVVETSSAAGFNFDGQSQQIAVVASSGDASDSSNSVQSVVTVPDQLADTQHVYVSESTKSEDGTQVTVKLSYMSDNPSLTGVGFSLEFDSNVLSFSGVSNVLTGAIADGDLNQDGDNLAFGWASLFGGWPGSNTAELATITFDIAEGATGSTGLNIQQTSTAAGYAFDGQSHDVIISAEADPQPVAAQLSIDASTGVVTLAGEADYDVVPNYSFTVTADNGTLSAEQTVALAVADQLVSSAADSYTGTDGADIFALTDGSADVTSGAGSDIFILSLNNAEAAHTLVDFESGSDSIDLSAALSSVGYSSDDNVTQLSAADLPADILDLISGSDDSLDNMFGGSFDDASNVLTIFADTNSDEGVTEIDTYQVTLGDDSSVEDDDITAVSFIA